MAEEASAKLYVDAVRGVRKDVVPQDAKDRFEYRDRHQTDDKHVEGAETAVNQHLVDDDLKKQRRNKREQLKKERRRQHLAKHVAILVNGAEKPADVETARQVDETAAARHQYQVTVPYRLELVARHQAGVRRVRRLDDRLVFPDLPEDDEIAIAQHRNAGQRRRGKSCPFGLVGARLEA